MTGPDPTEYAPDLHITCRHCGGRAVYCPPFYPVASPEGYDEQDVQRWGKGGWIYARFPTLMAFDPAVKSFNNYERGVVRCEACHQVYVIDLRVPDDLYYRWSIRGKWLYAYHRAHAMDLLAYIASTERDPEDYSHARLLKKTPSAFLAANRRDEIVKKIEKTLKDG